MSSQRMPIGLRLCPGGAGILLAIACRGALCGRPGRAAEAPARPGLAFVLFDDVAFQRPRESGTEERIDMELQGINDCSKLWLGRITFPVAGEVTLSAEADNGVRLFLDGKPVLDGWSPAGDRQARVRVTTGQPMPLRVEYFQLGGPAYLRLFWEWAGHPRELVPAGALDHTEEDRQRAQAIAEGREHTAPGNAPAVVSAPAGDEAFRADRYVPGRRESAGGPLRLGPGPHLFVDDALVERSSPGLRRRVRQPQREPAIPNPVITGPEDRAFQPFFTVLRDAGSGRFRAWYGASTESREVAASHIGTLESADGIHWQRPARFLDDPAPIQFGSSVLDEGPEFADPEKRYKLAWWKEGGLRIAASPDGLRFTPLAPHVLLRHNHDINNIWRDPLRNRYVATLSVYTTGPTWKGQRRATMHSVSRDLLHWEKPWYVVTPVDGADEGETQFYAMNAYLARGGLLLGMVKVLRDDLRAPGVPEGAYGVGTTALAWSRDGEHWTRDPEPFFQPDPRPDAWDHAHAWIDQQVPLGDQVYLYYGGYKSGHKWNRFEERQIGLVRIPRDRYVAREALDEPALLQTPLVTLGAARMTVNAEVRGELRVRLRDAENRPLDGFDFTDCAPVHGDSLAHAVRWRGGRLPRQSVLVEFSLRDALLYAFELTGE